MVHEELYDRLVSAAATRWSLRGEKVEVEEEEEYVMHRHVCVCVCMYM